MNDQMGHTAWHVYNMTFMVFLNAFVLMHVLGWHATWFEIPKLALPYWNCVGVMLLLGLVRRGRLCKRLSKDCM